ncbi:MAG: helix-hairpin-helix domain-containing protein [Nitrospira sp.]|nr:helix-hairpin-helix domain-containing protein [Nitrospira sp.]
MRRWSIRQYPTACSFGVKLLLLAGTVGFLSFAGLLQSPSQSTQSEAPPLQPAGRAFERLPTPEPVTGADVVSVDINRGSVEDLRRLPGIGPVLAERILHYRQENGKFVSIRDIQNVKGIGVKRFAQLEPYIHIDPKSSSSND